MTKLEQHLSNYAAYHLDRKNIITHFIGVPLIVFSILCLTGKFSLNISDYSINIALVLIILSCIYYFRLNWIFALIMAILYIWIYPYAVEVSNLPSLSWLAVSIGLFVIGWIFQFVGHAFEGKKPAFFDDIRGLIIGPLFVLAEFIFILGFRKQLAESIQHYARIQREKMDQLES